MKFLVVLAVAVACASAASSDIDAPILKSSLDINPEGTFQYEYETGNGIYAQASGNVKNQNSEYPSLEVQGGYKYTAPDGQLIEVIYVADENGFKPQGSHLPVAPEIPKDIARSLAYIAAHPPPAEVIVKAAPKPAYG